MRIWFPDWAYLDLVFSIAYNSISIIHYSKLMSLTSRMVARICSHFQLSSPITHQNEWRVSENEKKKKKVVFLSYWNRVTCIFVIPLNNWNPRSVFCHIIAPPFIFFPTLFLSRTLLLSIPTGTSCLSSQSATPTEQRYGFFLRLSIELRQWSWTYRYTRG